MWQSTALYFASDHPSAAGHFPSNPVVPGALVLDGVAAAIAGEAGESGIMIRAAKFLHPIRFGENILLRWQATQGGAVKFECRRAGEETLAMSGTIEMGQSSL
jgi:3-hydroxymyristoyl/3-hydroxydecanoyl-(acyl carrier protein) dehydratase